jgi:ABC-type sugar transport system ATPase subunit
MDEPTAALGSDESKQLVAITRQLAAEGCTIVFISHFLSEVLQVCDRVSVLRDGQLVRTGTARDETPESLVTSMIGRAVNVTFPHKTQPENAGEPVLEVKGLNSRSGLRNVDLKLWPGEILGIAGLVGSGRSELARAIFGVDSYDGTVEVQGKPVTLRSARQAVDAGIAMLPESRKELGLVLGRSVAENVTLPHLSKMDRWSFVRRGREAQAVSAVLAGVGVREGVTDLAVDNLSGGNQQKVMFAKWLVRSPKIFIADEPTQGVDVGAKAMIYDLIVGLAAKGMAVILISSELEEVVGLAHRVLVMRNGEIVNEFSDLTAAKDDILSHAFGTKLAVR